MSRDRIFRRIAQRVCTENEIAEVINAQLAIAKDCESPSATRAAKWLQEIIDGKIEHWDIGDLHDEMSQQAISQLESLFQLTKRSVGHNEPQQTNGNGTHAEHFRSDEL